MKQIKLRLDKDIYPIEAILNACYSFIDRFYFFLDTDGKWVTVSIKPQKNIKNAIPAVNQFKNELVCASLRQKISSANKKIREYIIGSALYSNELLATTEKLSYKNDPLGIATPWKKPIAKKYAETKI